ncbi:hypothetical protein K461DRAFT_264311 [Myriangium duriaei CBS 260.36]|uniref:Rhodopsin domain-containing protein n=1 Tax=Myriangium duriaei CBS 260.36 TaxID=1168546 RepID=A0A9P4J9N3_9PEZI|nr:hypothetical protein K461DRAFT_264311 [Myriangium duriaei CBS 260.36]
MSTTMTTATGAMTGVSSASMVNNPAISDWIARITQSVIALMVVCTALTGMRMFARAKLLNQFGCDDGAMLVAWALFITLGGLTIAEMGLEKDYFHGEVLDVSPASFWWNALYTASMIGSKCSFGFFLLRTTNPKNKWQRATTIGAFSACALLGVAYFCMSFTCAVTYDSAEQCSLTNAFRWTSVAWSALAIVVDLAYGVVFVWLIAVCDLNRRAKILTILIIIFGSLSGGSSLARIVTISTDKFSDPNVQRLAIRFWSIQEVGLCLAAPCVGSIQSFLRPYMNRPTPLGYQGQTDHTSRQNMSKRQTMSVEEISPVPPLMQADIEKGVVVKVGGGDRSKCPVANSSFRNAMNAWLSSTKRSK